MILIVIHLYLWLHRQGGGAGSADIRKMAYFEQSIDPAFAEVKKQQELSPFVTFEIECAVVMKPKRILVFLCSLPAFK